MRSRLSRVLAWTVIGAAPGIVLVLLAQFVIVGEMQLTVGAPGLLITAAGAITGLVYGLSRATSERRARRDSNPRPAE